MRTPLKGINDMAISPDGLYLATVADEGQVIVWSIQKVSQHSLSSTQQSSFEAPPSVNAASSIGKSYIPCPLRDFQPQGQRPRNWRVGRISHLLERTSRSTYENASGA